MFLGKNEVLNGFILKKLLYYYYYSDPKITREQKLRILCRICANSVSFTRSKSIFVS